MLYQLSYLGSGRGGVVAQHRRAIKGARHLSQLTSRDFSRLVAVVLHRHSQGIVARHAVSADEPAAEVDVGAAAAAEGAQTDILGGFPADRA